jgi:hypothetical protein
VQALRLRLLWLFLLLLAAFVVFVEFVAEVGGGSPGIPKPQPSPPPTATPVARTLPTVWPLIDL